MRPAADEAASQFGTWPAAGSFTICTERMPGQDSTAASAS